MASTTRQGSRAGGRRGAISRGLPGGTRGRSETRGRTSGSTRNPAGANAAGNVLQGDELQMDASSTGNAPPTYTAGDNTNLEALLEDSSSSEEELLQPPAQGTSNGSGRTAPPSQVRRNQGEEETKNRIAYFFKSVRKGARDDGKVAQLRNVVRSAVCPRLKFIHGEGFSATARKLEAEILGSFECPDLTKRKGYHYLILKRVGLYNPDKTLKDRVEYWKTYRDDVRKVILQERSSKTQAIKDCVIKGMFTL
jgi:hypothetical protein